MVVDATERGVDHVSPKKIDVTIILLRDIDQLFAIVLDRFNRSKSNSSLFKIGGGDHEARRARIRDFSKPSLQLPHLPGISTRNFRYNP